MLVYWRYHCWRSRTCKLVLVLVVLLLLALPGYCYFCSSFSSSLCYVVHVVQLPLPQLTTKVLATPLRQLQKLQKSSKLSLMKISSTRFLEMLHSRVWIFYEMLIYIEGKGMLRLLRRCLMWIVLHTTVDDFFAWVIRWFNFRCQLETINSSWLISWVGMTWGEQVGLSLDKFQGKPNKILFWSSTFFLATECGWDKIPKRMGGV